MTTLGKIEEFDVRGGKIDRYLERLEEYLVANDIPPDSETSSRQRAILISVLGAEAYDIFVRPLLSQFTILQEFCRPENHSEIALCSEENYNC